MSKPTEEQRLEIESRLQAGQSKRSVSRELEVSYYQTNKIAGELEKKALSGTESGESVLPDALRLPGTGVADQRHPRTHAGQRPEAGVTPSQQAMETVTNPTTGETVDFMRVTELPPLEQPTEYLVSPDPVLPSKQTGTKFDELAMQENPEVAEAMYHPPVALPTEHTDDGRLYIRRRVRWHGHEVEGFEVSGEPLEGELGIDRARELPGWHESSHTYVVQYHPDTAEELLSGEPDWLEPHGKLPSGFEYSPTKGVVIRRHKQLTQEELEQQRFFRDQARVMESLG